MCGEGADLVGVWGEAGSEAHSHLWEAPRDLARSPVTLARALECLWDILSGLDSQLLLMLSAHP